MLILVSAGQYAINPYYVELGKTVAAALSWRNASSKPRAEGVSIRDLGITPPAYLVFRTKRQAFTQDIETLLANKKSGRVAGRFPVQLRGDLSASSRAARLVATGPETDQSLASAQRATEYAAWVVIAVALAHKYQAPP